MKMAAVAGLRGTHRQSMAAVPAWMYDRGYDQNSVEFFYGSGGVPRSSMVLGESSLGNWSCGYVEDDDEASSAISDGGVEWRIFGDAGGGRRRSSGQARGLS